jgi:hypothetical protein
MRCTLVGLIFMSFSQIFVGAKERISVLKYMRKSVRKYRKKPRYTKKYKRAK